MTNFNQTLKAKVDKEFPPKVYPCSCKFECTRLGGDEECDNCNYCGTAMDDADIAAEQSANYVAYHRGGISHEEYNDVRFKEY